MKFSLVFFLAWVFFIGCRPKEIVHPKLPDPINGSNINKDKLFKYSLIDSINNVVRESWTFNYYPFSNRIYSVNHQINDSLGDPIYFESNIFSWNDTLLNSITHTFSPESFRTDYTDSFTYEGGKLVNMMNPFQLFEYREGGNLPRTYYSSADETTDSVVYEYQPTSTLLLYYYKGSVVSTREYSYWPEKNMLLTVDCKPPGKITHKDSVFYIKEKLPSALIQLYPEFQLPPIARRRNFLLKEKNTSWPLEYTKDKYQRIVNIRYINQWLIATLEYY